ncbi:E3 ubiquitin-protein ligase TRIM31 [Lemmus lemmus]
MENRQGAKKQWENVTCPICKKILQDPVTIDCGHNFCLQCINQVGKTTNILQCPLCKLPVNKNTFKANKLLASIAKKIKDIDPAELQPEEEPRCQNHKEKFHYFCEEDGEFLCLLCRNSKDHETHEVTSIDEAAQKYKVQIETLFQDLVQKDKEIIKEKKKHEEAIQVIRAQVLLEKLKILQEFKHVHQRLEEEQIFLLSRLSLLEQEEVKPIEECITDTQGQLTTLKDITESLKNRLQAPPMELLELISTYLHRGKEFQFHNPTPVPMNLEKKISEANASDKSIIETLKELTGKMCLPLPVLTCIRILSITPDTA